MSHDDEADFAALRGALPAPDLDTTTAERIALRARAEVGKGAPKRRLVLPLVVGIPAAIYTAWVVCGILDIFK